MSFVSWLCASPIKAMGLAAAIVLSAPMPAALAGSPFERFVGVWTGGGQMVGSNGHRESMRCRAEYSEAKGGAALNQSIVCASESFKFDITSYSEASGDSLQGTWKEASRDVSGHMSGRISEGQFVGEFSAPAFSAGISLTANGRTQTVSIQPRGGDISEVHIELKRHG
jgi:hypothetical protein